MECAEARGQLDAYVDGEVDAVRSRALEEHVRGCAHCAREVSGIRALRAGIAAAGLYHAAPAPLMRRARRLNRAGWSRWPDASFAWQAVAAAGWAVAAAFVILFLVTPASRHTPGDAIEQEVVASHIRSLMPGHLTDVVSSNQHTVKPWFEGKVNFSPRVNDLTVEGFPLIGGRLDYVDGRRVAAIVYHYGAHPINLFVWPAEAPDSSPVSATRDGYNVIHWTHSGESLWAVSSVSKDALEQFVADLRQAEAGPTPSSISK